MILQTQGFGNFFSRMVTGAEAGKPAIPVCRGETMEPGAFFKILTCAADRIRTSNSPVDGEALPEDPEMADVLVSLLALMETGDPDMPAADGKVQFPASFLKSLVAAGGPENPIAPEEPGGVETRGTAEVMPRGPALAHPIVTEMPPGDGKPSVSIGNSGMNAPETPEGQIAGDPQQDLENWLRFLAPARNPGRQVESAGEMKPAERPENFGKLPQAESVPPGNLHELTGRLVQMIAAARIPANQETVPGEKQPAVGPEVEVMALPARPDAGQDRRGLLEQMLQTVEAGRVHPREKIVSGEKTPPLNLKAGTEAQARALEQGTAGTDVRQYLNSLAGQLQNASAAGDEAIGTAEPDAVQKVQNMETLIGRIESMPRDSEIRNPADPILQPQPANAVPEKPVGASPDVRHAAMVPDNDIPAFEQKIVGQVFVRLFNGVRQDSGNMTIHLHPPELGRVRIRLISEQGNLNIQLHSQNHQVVGIMERHLPSLQQALEDQGILLSDLQVSVDSGSQGEPQFEREQGGQTQRRLAAAPIDDEPAQPVAKMYRKGPSHARELSLRV